MWRFRGSPHYIDRQAARMGITQVLADRARHNPELYRIATLLAQLSERYHRARKENGVAVLYTTELAQVKGTLEQCEQELQKLHILAGAADAMLGPAWEAFGLSLPHRPFGVVSESDTQQLPLGDGTVGTPDGQAPALSESG
jgi:hypothetical protein